MERSSTCRHVQVTVTPYSAKVGSREPDNLHAQGLVRKIWAISSSKAAFQTTSKNIPWNVLSLMRGIFVWSHAQWLSRVQLCDPMDGCPPGSSVHGILQERIRSGLPCPPPGDLPDSGIEFALACVFCIAGGLVDSLSTQEACGT